MYDILSNKDMWNNTSALAWAILNEAFRRAIVHEVEQQNSFVRILRSIGSRALPIQSPEELAYAKYPLDFEKAASFLTYRVEYRTGSTYSEN